MAIYNNWTERAIIYSIAASTLALSWIATVHVTDFKDGYGNKNDDKKERFIQEYSGETPTNNTETKEEDNDNTKTIVQQQESLEINEKVITNE